MTTKKQAHANKTSQKAIVSNDVNEAATEIVKQKRKRPDLSELQSPQTQPGEISRMLGQAMTISKWPRVDTNNAEQIEQRISDYYQFCFDNDIKPDMSGMALAIGVDRVTLWKWENGVDGNKPAAVRNALKKARETNEYLMNQLMQNGKLNPVTGIFLMKNNFGYKDQQDVIITPNTPAEGRDPSDIRSQYIQALPEET